MKPQELVTEDQALVVKSQALVPVEQGPVAVVYANPHLRRFKIFNNVALAPFSLVMKQFGVDYSIADPYGLLVPRTDQLRLKVMTPICWVPAAGAIVASIAFKQPSLRKYKHVLDGLSSGLFLSSVVSGALQLTIKNGVIPAHYLPGVIASQAGLLLLCLPSEYFSYQMRHHNKEYSIPAKVYLRIYKALAISGALSPLLGIWANGLHWMDPSVIWYTAAGTFGVDLILQAGLYHQAQKRHVDSIKFDEIHETIIQNGALRGLSIAAQVFFLMASYYAIDDNYRVTDPALIGFGIVGFFILALYFTGSIVDYLFMPKDENPEVAPLLINEDDASVERGPQIQASGVPQTMWKKAKTPELPRVEILESDEEAEEDSDDNKQQTTLLSASPTKTN